MSDQNEPGHDDILHAKIALETARIAWRELQRFFAAGSALYVAPELDLVQAATALANDDKACFERWLATRQVAPVSDQQAQQWYEGDRDVWAVVVAPWVLVQAVQ